MHTPIKTKLKGYAMDTNKDNDYTASELLQSITKQLNKLYHDNYRDMMIAKLRANETKQISSFIIKK
jgi:hypothetical protein